MSNETVNTEEKQRKSIVPAKYGTKYKSGGSDELANFINEQCTVEGSFSYESFFSLARKNGIAEEHVAQFETALEEKRHGAQGRARMTIRNRLAPIARKQGSLVGLDGEEHAVTLPPLPARGKAAGDVAEAAE